MERSVTPDCVLYCGCSGGGGEEEEEEDEGGLRAEEEAVGRRHPGRSMPTMSPPSSRVPGAWVLCRQQGGMEGTGMDRQVLIDSRLVLLGGGVRLGVSTEVIGFGGMQRRGLSRLVIS